MKLKLNTQQGSDSRQPSTAEATPTPGGTLKLNLNRKPSANNTANGTGNTSKIHTPAVQPPSNSTAPTSNKKRAAESQPAGSAPAKKLIKLKKSDAASLTSPVQRKGSIIRLKKQGTGPASPLTPGGTSIRPSLRITKKGKPPVRPPGAGYDSECDDAEVDPAIEENFILRMAPGADAEYIRKAIEERRVGVPVREGGADFNLRFFSKDARRACVRVQDRFYSAVLVDLPCIVESMKSWDKKGGWWKSADICQMLLVTGRVESEDAAREAPLPREMDKESWAWPHGLTPPMYDVRRRRFRKKTDNRRVEQLEEEVERLLAEDARARERGGRTESRVMTVAELKKEEEGPSESEEEEEEEEEEEDAEGELEDADGDAEGEVEEEIADDDFTREIENLAEEAPADQSGTSVTPTATVEVDRADLPPQLKGETSGEEIEVEVEQDSNQPEREGRASDDESGSNHDDDDDEDDEASDEDISEEAREKRERLAQQKEEIDHLEQQIAEKKVLLGKQTNQIMRNRLLNTIKKFEEDRDVKKRGLGLPTDDDDDDD